MLWYLKNEKDEDVYKYTERAALALLAFIERAAKEGATAEEVQALPAVAQEFYRLMFATS